MCGQKGMIHTRSRKNTFRARAWRSIRIKPVGFDVPFLLRTVPGAGASNIKHFMRCLYVHGIIDMMGGSMAGRKRIDAMRQKYRLKHIFKEEPHPPSKCARCGLQIRAKSCKSGAIKEAKDE